VHISYCTGDAGKHATAASSAQNLLLLNSSQPDDSTSKPPSSGGMDKGKQRKTDIDVEAEQSRLSEERKRKAKTNEGDDRFNKKSKAEEAVESKKFDVTEEELGTEVVLIDIAKVKSNKFLQRDFGVKGIGWRIQWRTTLIIRSFNYTLDHVIEMNDFRLTLSPFHYLFTCV
jgi:hypothetical protein